MSNRRIVLDPAIPTDSKSELIGGLFREIIRPQAIARTFWEEIDVRSLVNHDTNLILGRLSAHTLTLLRTADGIVAVDLE